MESMSTPETYVLNSLCDYLQIRRVFFWRVNNIPVYMPKKNCFRAMPKYSVKGVSDIIAVHKGKAYFIEAKAPKQYQSKEQKEFQKNIELSGNVYILAKSVDDLIVSGL